MRNWMTFTELTYYTSSRRWMNNESSYFTYIPKFGCVQHPTSRAKRSHKIPVQHKSWALLGILTITHVTRCIQFICFCAVLHLRLFKIEAVVIKGYTYYREILTKNTFSNGTKMKTILRTQFNWAFKLLRFLIF